MRRFSLSSLALLCACASSATAADLPPAISPAMTPAQVVAFSWTGVYIGVNGGYGAGSVSNIAGTASASARGAFAGGQIGANYQSGMWVIGVEGDMQASWQTRNYPPFTIGGVLFTTKEEFPWFATARARAGIAVDRALFYVTGGAVWGAVKISQTSTPGTTISSANDTQAAWTAGAGIEYAIVDRWSVKAEYLYIDTGNRTLTFFGVPGNGRFQDNLGRVGVNYHF